MNSFVPVPVAGEDKDEKLYAARRLFSQEVSTCPSYIIIVLRFMYHYDDLVWQKCTYVAMYVALAMYMHTNSYTHGVAMPYAPDE